MEPAEGAAVGGNDGAGGSVGGSHRRPTLAPRIKRMMQADDDVGKIAGLTPLAVGKAMELFLGTVVTKACAAAKKRGAKLLSTGHLKESLAGDELYDFLQDVVSSAPDLPPLAAGGPKQPTSRGAGAAAAKRKAPARAAQEGAEQLDDDDDDGGDEDTVQKKKAKPRAAPGKSAGAAQQAAAAPAGDAAQPAHAGAAEKAAPRVEEVPLAFAAAAVAPPADMQGEEDYDC